MSYYNNAPRFLTPSALKSTKTFSPIESVNLSPTPSPMSSASSDSPVDPFAAANAVNVCHRSRGSNLQHTHPRTYALLRRVEAEKTHYEAK